jgi:hypothetical protein
MSNCDEMRKITVSIDEQTYRRARIKAAGQATSISALIKRFLVEFAEESEADRLMRDERELRERIRKFRAAPRLSRDQVHERRR